MPPRVVATLRPIADRPDADAYSLSLDRPRARPQRRSATGAALYLARAAQPAARRARRARSARARASSPRSRAAAEDNPGDGPAQVRLISALLARGQATRRSPAPAGCRRTIPACPRSICWSATRSASAAISPAPPPNIAAPPISPSPKAVAMRLIEALQRSGQADEADNVLSLFVQQNPRSVPGPDPARRARDAGAGLADGDRDLRGAARSGSATMTRPSSTISPGPIPKSGDLDRAVPLARRAWSLDRDNPATADTLGWLLFKAGRRAEGPRPARARRPRRAERRRDPAAPGPGARRLAQAQAGRG